VRSLLRGIAFAGLLVAGTGVAGVSVARADTNQAPIAVPLIGTQGKASLYPSVINVVARGGLGQTGQVRVVLHAVTHPCPEDLSIQLVHDGKAYLLMNRAGGCRPLQGTTLVFDANAAPIPTNPPVSPPFPALETVDMAPYAGIPVFPPPAENNVFYNTMPPPTTNINGTWSLFVFDRAPGNRGVIAGGWSLNYDTSPTFDSTQTAVRVPAVGTGPGGAEHYPITFDLSTVPEGVLARNVDIDVTLNHTLPDNLRMALQSPQGTTVILMANAGGGTDVAPGTELRFRDVTALDVPDAGPIVTGQYRPGSIYEASVTLGLPAPQTPYATELAAFDGEPAHGIWKLWVYDDSALNFGEIESAELTVRTDNPYSFTFSGQTTPFSFSSDQPFVHFEGSVAHETVPYSFHWRNVANNTFYEAGAFSRGPGPLDVFANVPVKAGSNVVTAFIRTTAGDQFTETRIVNVSEFTYSLAEGATGTFFDLDITLANPAAADAPIQVDFLPENGTVVPLLGQVDAQSPKQFRVDTYVPGAAVSTVVHSQSAVPLAVERTMSWDERGYGGHGGTSVAPATRWLFAEGSQGFFNTFVLLANDNLSPVDVTIDFLLEGGGLVTVPVSVPAKSRHTLFAGDVAGIVNRSFGISINASNPIIAERAMYLPGPHLLEGGHESAGVNSPSTRWFLAEGATGGFFDCFVLLGNPNGSAANVTLTYLLPNGSTVQQPLVMPPNSRSTINVETVDPQLANTAVSTTITSDVGIVAERAMYWPDISQGWVEAHNSFGMTETGLRWGIADGRIGGPREHQTYILLANPNPVPAEIEVTFLKSGGNTVSRAFTIEPTSRVNIWANGDVPELGEGTFSADIRVVNYQPIAVEKALYWNAEGVVWAAGTNVTATRLPPP
jgi:subtilisin-like proprotein convertase family protein